jgi:hypothetical protein
MKWLLRILTFLSLYLLLCSKGCNDNMEADEAREQEKTAMLKDSIMSSFESDSLSEKSLQAFGATASQMFSDFTEYLKILDDTTIAPAFRKKTEDMIRGLFISGNSIIRIPGTGLQGMKEITLAWMTQPGHAYTQEFGLIHADSVRVKKSLERKSDSLYAGELSFPVNPELPARSGSLASRRLYGTVDFVATRRSKTFGKDTVKIWTVFLGK